VIIREDSISFSLDTSHPLATSVQGEVWKVRSQGEWQSFLISMKHSVSLRDANDQNT